MSYILEAIKRSERERLTVGVPGLPMLSAFGQATKQPSFLRYGAASAAMIAVGMAIGWLRPWQPAHTAVAPVIEKAAPAPGQPMSMAAAEEAPLHPMAPAATRAREKAEVLHVMKVRPYRAPARVASANPALAGPDTPAATPRASPVAPPLVTPVAPHRTPAAGPMAATAPTAAPEGAAPRSPNVAAAAGQKIADAHPQAAAATDVPMAAATPRAAAREGKVMTLYELPPAILREIPPMSISGFTYSDMPQGRMVDINDHLLQEGQYVTDGLKLEQITPNGLVFSYRHYRFRKNLP